MHVKTTGPFQVSKAGNSEADCEDKVNCRENPQAGIETSTFSCAVADGATDSAFSGRWAEKLVNAYVNAAQEKPPTPQSLYQIIKEEAPKWSSEIRDIPSLPWFVYEKMQRGAFSTLLGLCLEDKSKPEQPNLWSGSLIPIRGKYTWTAFGIGDTCVFQIRDNKVNTKFPIEKAGQFSNHPALIATQPSSNEQLERTSKPKKGGQWKSGDRFLLMTDALAHWFLLEVEAKRKPWVVDLAEDRFEHTDQFATWIDDLRAKKEIRNDDVTLLMLKVEP